MKSIRFAVSMFVAALFVTFSLSVSAQTTRHDSGTDLNTHRFKPAQDPAAHVKLSPGAPRPTTIGANAIQQMNALNLDKKMRTPTQKKISSRLLYASRMMSGLPAAIGVPYLRSNVELDDNNNFYVDIAAKVSDGLLQKMRQAGAHIIRSSTAYHSIRAFVPPSSLETIAGYPDVIFISPKRGAMTEGPMPPPSARKARQLAPGFERRAANVRKQLSRALSTRPDVGSEQSEGDAAHRAAEARATFGISGAGIKIGVLSDGVSTVSESQALGDLPPTCPAGGPCLTILPGQVGDGDEGTAMLEIIHDLAPGASLYFATAFNSIESFAQNIRDLRTAGCDIIVDDVFYFVETPFQDGQDSSIISDTNGGVVIQAINDVTDDGALYFSSAGNEGNVDDGTAGVFEGDFVDGGTNPLLTGGTVAQMGANPFNTITADGEVLFLFWSDPLGGSSNDYDLFVLDPTGTTVLDASTDTQDGTIDPVEGVGTDAADDLAVVFQVTGAADRFFHLNTFRGGLEAFTSGQTHGHSSSAGAFSVAATDAGAAFPNPFDASDVSETFTSDGPRHLFFEGDGTAFTPGDFSSTGGIIRQKPDITAADGVSVTGAGGFPSTFFGTSAAAPHGGAIAGLIMSGAPGATRDEVIDALTSTAIDIEDPGVDRDTGAGIVMAVESATALGVVPGANPELGTVTTAENPGDGDGGIEAGEGGSVTIELTNVGGVVDATGITATLSSTTPGIIITQPATTTYPNLTAGSGTATNSSPLTFTVDSSAACGAAADFALTVTYSGGPSPRVLTFSVPTGPPATTFTTTLDGTAPTPLPGFTTATGTQKGRVFRDGVPSTCGNPKAFPGYGATTGARAFDSFTFNACRDTCTQVSVTTADNSFFSAMYSPSLDVNDVAVNYVGDAGLSSTSSSYAVDTTQGNDYTVVVHEVNTGGGVGKQYTVAISGCALDCTPPNNLPDAVAQNVTVAGDATGFADVSVDNGSSDPDEDEITITQTPPSPYPTGTTNVTLTVVDPKGATDQATATVTVYQDFTVPATVPDATVTAGQTATTTFTITPISSVDTPITFSCTGLPSHSSCDNPTVTPGGSPVDVTLSITTHAGNSAKLHKQNAPMYALLMPFGGLGLISLAGVGGNKRARKAMIALALLAMMMGFMVMAGCGSDSHPPQGTAGTPPGSYSVTVTSTAGLAVHSSTFTLTVQ